MALSWLFPGSSVLGQVSMIYESVRALGALLTTPPARLTISIHGRFRIVVSAIAERGTLNATRVHAKSSRELRAAFVVRAPALLVGSLRVGGHAAVGRGQCFVHFFFSMHLNEPPLLLRQSRLPPIGRTDTSAYLRRASNSAPGSA